MKPAGLAPKGTVTRLMQEARSAWNQRDLSQCAEMLEKAHRLAPAEVGILLQLGRIRGLLYDYEAAEHSFEEAVRIAPTDQKVQTLAGAAQHAQAFFNPDIAERYFRRAIAGDAVTSDMLVNMAEFMERRRGLEEAHSLLDRALELDSECEGAWLVRARLLGRAGKHEEAERDLRRLLEQTAAVEIRIRAGSELGAVLDRQGRYDEAMEAFVEAKNLLRPAVESQIAPREFMRKRLAQMRTQISREMLDSWFEFGRKLQPARRLAVLAGHPRSGTTLMEQVLDAHPDVVSIEETTHFADYAYSPLNRRWPAGTPILKVLDSASKELLESYRDRYFRAADLCLGSPVGPRLLIDKNPSLTVLVPAFARVFPEARFLVMLRDPRDVVLSCFLQPVLSVQQASYPYSSLKTTAEAYSALMQTWKTVASALPNPYLEIRYEDMVKDLHAVAQKTLHFLGVPWDEIVMTFDQHARSKLVRSPTYADVTHKVFERALGRWQHYEKYLGPHLHLLEPFIKAFGYG